MNHYIIMDDNEFYANCNKNKRIKELEKEIEELKKDKDGYSDDTGLMFQTAYKISIRLMEERQKHIRTKLEKAKLEKEIKELKKNNEELQQANERLRNTLCFKTIEDLSKKNIELTQEIAKMMNQLVEGLEEKLELQREIEILKYRSF